VAAYLSNLPRGRVHEFYRRVVGNDPNTSVFKVILLKVNEAAGTLVDQDTVASMLLSNTEANFTNYVRKVLTDANLAAVPAPDDTNNKMVLQFPTQTWTSAGGAVNNTLTMACIAYFPDTAGADSTGIPCAFYDFATTTNGTDISISWPSGFYQSV